MVHYKRKRFKIRLVSIDKKFRLEVHGPLGMLYLRIPKHLMVKQDYIFSCKKYINPFSTFLINCIRSLIYGYFVEIHTEGVGFKFNRFEDEPNVLELNLGHSHSLYLKIPNPIIFRTLKYRLILFSANLMLLNNFALHLRCLRLPDAYKGKGLKFSNEVLKFKPGKLRQR